MDLKLLDAEPTADERAAVDARLGPPAGAWDGGERGSQRDAHVAHTGKGMRDRRHELLPALQALQARVGWISEGGFNYVCERLNVPPADAWGVATFYAMLATTPRPKRVLHVCDDIACRAKGALDVCKALDREVGHAIAHAPGGDHVKVGETGWMHSPCLGLCDVAPAALVTDAGDPCIERSFGHVTGSLAVDILGGRALPPDATAESGVRKKMQLLERIDTADPTSLDAYRAAGGFAALEKARAMGAEAVLAEVNAAGLIGRGGAGFPTGRKWAAVRAQPATPRYLICNADESEPGTFKDRVLLTGDPFAIVEAMAIAAFAAGCSKGFVYIRAEYPLGAERMQNAIDQARTAGLFDGIATGDSQFDIEIRRGAGAYICGEETAIFESIEGKRGEPRNKPPFPSTHGLFGKPTVVNNVETLANVIPIVLNGGAAFAKIGTRESTGTRLFCVSGHVGAPGVYEVPMGITLGELLDLAGGTVGKIQAILMGGAAGGFVRGDELGLRLTHEDTRAAGTTLGSGVVVPFNDTVDLKDIVLRVAAFFRDESCGQCVPCRVGTVRQEESLHRIVTRRTLNGVRGELDLLEEIGAGMKDGSICGLGQTAYAVVESAIKRLGLFGGATA